jgi:hypothetical protein
MAARTPIPGQRIARIQILRIPTPSQLTHPAPSPSLVSFLTEVHYWIGAMTTLAIVNTSMFSIQRLSRLRFHLTRHQLIQRRKCLTWNRSLAEVEAESARPSPRAPRPPKNASPAAQRKDP